MALKRNTEGVSVIVKVLKGFPHFHTVYCKHTWLHLTGLYSTWTGIHKRPLKGQFSVDGLHDTDSQTVPLNRQNQYAMFENQ